MNQELSEDEAYDHNDCHNKFEEIPCRHSPSITFSIPMTSLLEYLEYDLATSATLNRGRSHDTDQAESVKC
jgi:hypothetical protein